MPWHYRIVEHDEGEDVYFALHEYHPNMPAGERCPAEPVSFVTQDRAAMIEALEAALADARQRPVLRMSELRGGVGSRG